MFHFRFATLAVALCFVAITPMPALASRSEFDLRSQLQLLISWWPGEYDNHEQIVRQSGGGLSTVTDKPFYRVHSRYERVTASPLGEQVLAVVDYRDDDPTRVLRARTYVVSIDQSAGALRVVQYASKVPGSAELASLGPSCDLLLHFVGGQFEGSLPSKSCKVAGQPDEYGLVVGSRYIWYREKSGQEWFEQTKARLFTCMVQESADGDMRKTRFLKTIRLHDQGGEADIAWPDGRTLTFTIHTRAFTSPSKIEYPLFRIHEKGKIVPIAYAYASNEAGHFGLNLGWFYIRCYAEGEDLGADAVYNK